MLKTLLCLMLISCTGRCDPAAAVQEVAPIGALCVGDHRDSAGSWLCISGAQIYSCTSSGVTAKTATCAMLGIITLRSPQLERVP